MHFVKWEMDTMYVFALFTQNFKFPIHSQRPSYLPLRRLWIQISMPAAWTSVAVAVVLGVNLEINKACFCCLGNLHCDGEINLF